MKKEWSHVIPSIIQGVKYLLLWLWPDPSFFRLRPFFSASVDRKCSVILVTFTLCYFCYDKGFWWKSFLNVHPTKWFGESPSFSSPSWLGGFSELYLSRVRRKILPYPLNPCLEKNTTQLIRIPSFPHYKRSRQYPRFGCVDIFPVHLFSFRIVSIN